MGTTIGGCEAIDGVQPSKPIVAESLAIRFSFLCLYWQKEKAGLRFKPYKIVVIDTFFDTFGVADLQANRAPHPPHGGPPSPLGKVNDLCEHTEKQ